MSKIELRKDIIENDGWILSDGTLKVEHLLCKCYDAIIAYNLNSRVDAFITIRENLRDDIRELFEGEPTFYNSFYGRCSLIPEKEDDACQLLNNEIWDFMNNIAPEGYYFGSSEGDGALIGFFRYYE